MATKQQMMNYKTKKLLSKKKWHTLDEIRNAADKIQNV